MEQILTNDNSNDECCEFEKMKLCRVALVLQKKLIELKDKDDLCIRFPIWLWYRHGFDAVTCEVVDIKMKDIEKFSLEWYKKYIILTIHGKNTHVDECVRFDDEMEFTMFVNNILIHLVNTKLDLHEFPLLFPGGCVLKTIYDGLYVVQ